MELHCWSLCACLLVCFLSISNGSEYCVIPQDGHCSTCPEGYSECNDLSYYARQSYVYFTSDTILTFLPGIHILDSSDPIVISDVSNLTLQGNGRLEVGFHPFVRQSNVIITCNGSHSGFLFRNFDEVSITGLTIANCSYELSDDLASYISSRFFETRYNWEYAVTLTANFSLLAFNGTDLSISSLSLQNGTGYGLTIVNVYNIEISTSWFTHNNFECNGRSPDPVIRYRAGGNIRIAYIDASSCPAFVEPASSISLTNVYVTNGSNCGAYREFSKLYEFNGNGAGLTVMATSYQCSMAELELNGVIALVNTASMGPNVLIFGLPITTTINGLNCQYGFRGYIGGGLTVYVTQEPPSGVSTKFTVANSYFISNGGDSIGAGSGSAFLLVTYTKAFFDEVRLVRCTFWNNIGVSTIHIVRNDFDTPQSLKVTLSAVTVRGNVLNPRSRLTEFSFNGAIVLMYVDAYADNLVITDNNRTGIEVYASTLELRGSNLIQNNFNRNGGGMIFVTNSILRFYSPPIGQPPTQLNLYNNTAVDFGGAIYIPPLENSRSFMLPCFIQFVGSSDLSGVVINAEGNTAGITGSILSGGNLGGCYITGNSNYSFGVPVDSNPYNSIRFFISLIKPEIDPSTDLYLISSSPVYVALCNSSGLLPDEDQNPIIDILQGKTFDINVFALGDTRGVSAGNIMIVVSNCSGANFQSCSDLPDQTFTYSIPNNCTSVSVVVKGNEYSTNMSLRMVTVDMVFSAPVPYRLRLVSSECPPGFTKKEVCECNEYVNSTGATCNINTTSISTNGSVWIGYDSTSSATLYSYECTYDYCIREPVTFNILEPDAQCAYNRSGILCGGCAEGYSLLLGTNECGECPNDNYLSLLLVFGIAGILLVVLLILLNLTVSVGTINGLIFYANIVKINDDVFFPEGGSNPIILKQFISFMNLDFGISTCFFQDMTPYIKAWLQFVFPVYIWVIMFVIMLLSSRFTRLAKLIGNNAVKVLATLLLLSYTKLIRAIGVAFGRRDLFRDDSSYSVWRFDAGMNFGSFEIIVLMIFASLFLLIFVLPYSAILLSLPVLNRLLSLIKSSFLSLRLKPFADAYAGPFKPSHQFWVGLLLFIRVIVTIVKNAEDDGDASLYLVIFIVMFLLVLALDLQGPYKKIYLNVLESWFLMNLLGLCVLALGNNDTAKYGAIVSVSLVIITFVIIIFVHIYWLCDKQNWFRKLKLRLLKPKSSSEKAADLTASSKPMVTSGEFTLSENTYMTTMSTNPSNKTIGSSTISIAPARAPEFSKYRDSIFEDET